MSTGKIGEGITGEPEGGAPADEREHFETCPECVQAFDKRDLAQVVHHGTSGHEPMLPNA